MEWKITPSYRLGLLGGAAAVALLSATPIFAANTQTATQVGTNDSETQVQQAGVTGSKQYIFQSTTNASYLPVQAYQLQATGSKNNYQYASQKDFGAYQGGNSLTQKQVSDGNVMYSWQHGANNTVRQYQNGGGYNFAVVGNNVGEGGQYGAGNYVHQTQLGSDEYQKTYVQRGNYNSSTQFQNFTGTSKSNQYVFQEGDNNIAVQNQYSNAYQKINQDKNVPKGYGNNANQFQAASTSASSYEKTLQYGARNYAEQKQYRGVQKSIIVQIGGFGAGNLGYTFQTGYTGNFALVYQGPSGKHDYNGRAYVDQFGAASGGGNVGEIFQSGNSGGTTKSTARATIKQGSASTPVYGDNVDINQFLGYARATGTVDVYSMGTGYSYALAKQLGNEESSIIRQLNAGASGNVAYTFQSGPGHGYSGVYQGGFNSGGSLYRLGSGGGNGTRPFGGSSTGVTYHPNTPSFDQFATNDRAYIDQWNGSGATFNGNGTPNNSNTNLAMIYQNTPNSTAVIVQGSKNSGVWGDAAIILQCNGVGFACGGESGGGGGTFGYSSRGRNPGNTSVTTVPGGMYGNDVAKIYQQNNQEYAKIVQRGLNDYMSLTQTGIGNTFTLYQTGVNNHVVQVQH